MYKKTIVVDFDGVIHSYTSPFVAPEFIPDPPVVGALDFLKRVIENPDYELNLYSTRNNSDLGINAMQLWLKHWFRIEYGWAVGASLGNLFEKHSSLLPANHKDYWDFFPREKPTGWINIDDRVFLFRGLFPTFEEINNFKAWNDADKVKYQP